MARHLSERGAELAFGVGWLLIVAVPFVAAEALARWYVGGVRERTVDWRSLIETTGVGDDGPARFRPHARYGTLVFNERGLRGPPLPVPAPARTLRIAFVGDSKLFSADVAEAQTLGAQTTRRLGAARPGCRFDYVSLSGPGYTTSFLARLWREQAPTLKPDLAVVLAGSPVELIAAIDGKTAGKVTTPRAPSLIERSSFLTLLSRELQLLSPVVWFDRRNDLPAPVLNAGYRRMTDGLVQAMHGTPTIAVGYRSRLRTTQDSRQRRFATRELRQSIPGLSVDGAITLSDAVVVNLAKVSQTAGWQFVDPIAAIPPDGRHFIDRTHFTALGLERLAAALVAQIAPAVDGDCRLVEPLVPKK